MNIADKLKSNIVVIPVVASIVVGSFTGIKYVLNLTNTINSNKEAMFILQDKINEQNEVIKKSNQDISHLSDLPSQQEMWLALQTALVQIDTLKTKVETQERWIKRSESVLLFRCSKLLQGRAA